MTELKNIAFEQVDGDYYRGRYGDFDAILRKTDGYVNVTKLCAAALNRNGNPKDFFNWVGKQATDIKEAASIATGLSIDQLTDVIVGGTKAQVEISGTYAHPKLVPHIASWASPIFAMHVSDIVNAAIVRDHERAIAAKDDKIDELKEMLRQSHAQLNEKLDISNQKHEITHQKLDNITSIVTETRADTVIVEQRVEDLRNTFIPEQIAPQPTDPTKEQVLILTRVTDTTYKTTRCQVGAKKRSLAKLARDPNHTEATVVYECTPCANPGRVSIQVLDELRIQEHVIVRYQTITLTNPEEFSEDDLIQTFTDAANQYATAVHEQIVDLRNGVAGIREKLTLQ